MLSTKNLLKLVAKQRELDQNIIKKKELTVNQELIDKKIIALLVEIGEFINEERSFKYWSIKPSSAREVMLEEYIDGVHFILSLGTDFDFDFQNYHFQQTSDSLIKTYLDCYAQVSQFQALQNDHNYKLMLDAFFTIAVILNFSETEIMEAYKQKNQINFNRQDSNY